MRWNAPAHIIEQAKKSQHIEILPENWLIVTWFNEVTDLMRYHHHLCLGLDLTQIQAEASMSGREYTPEQFKGLRLMSKTAAKELNERNNE